MLLSAGYRWLLLVLMACAQGALLAQRRVGGADLPDTSALPRITREVWTGLPKGYVLPNKVDLSPWFPPVGDQGPQASCVTWAMCYGLMTYRSNRREGRTYGPDDPVDSASTYSPAFLYNMKKGFYMTPTKRDPALCDDGTDMEDMLTLAMLAGCCPLSSMPYDTALSACARAPHFDNVLSAIKHFVPPAIQLDSGFIADEWRYHLSQGRPVLASMVVDEVFQDSGFATGGTRPFIWGWHPRGMDLFGHALICTGYDDDSTFNFMNSWGNGWGYHGRFKATVKRLRMRCSGSYVMTNDSLVTSGAGPGTPADGDHDKGPVVRETLDPGEYQHVNEQKIGLASVSDDGGHAVVQVFHAGTDTLMRTITARTGSSYVMYSGTDRLELNVRQRGRLLRSLGKDMHLQVRTTPAATDLYLRDRNERIRRLHKTLEHHP